VSVLIEESEARSTAAKSTYWFRPIQVTDGYRTDYDYITAERDRQTDRQYPI